jgi:hypothetical protein
LPSGRVCSILQEPQWLGRVCLIVSNPVSNLVRFPEIAALVAAIAVAMASRRLDVRQAGCEAVTKLLQEHYRLAAMVVVSSQRTARLVEHLYLCTWTGHRPVHAKSDMLVVGH